MYSLCNVRCAVDCACGLWRGLNVVLYSVLDNIVWYYLKFPSELYDNKLSMRKLYLSLSLIEKLVWVRKTCREAGLSIFNIPYVNMSS